jgi:O-antigen/teichoic acid export membrane protein
MGISGRIAIQGWRLPSRDAGGDGDVSVRKALGFAYLEKYGSFVLSLAATMIISRLLSPSEIGVFSIGMAVVGLAAIVREFGVSTYIVQEVNLNELQIRAAFTVATALGVGLSVVVLLLSVPAGMFYGDPTATLIVAIMGLTFLLTPFGVVSQALLSREMRFGTLAWIRLLFGVVLSVSSVALAAAGMGPQSLAWAAVLAGAANSVVSLVVRPHAMRFTNDRSALLRVFQVGGATTAISVIDEVITALPELLLGRLQGLSAVGLFSRARGMSQMAHQVLARSAGPVFFAAFAERKRAGIPLGPDYIRATACITAIGWAGLMMLGVLADPVVRVLFGSNWLGAVSPLRWLCVAAAIALLTSGAAHLLLADGAARNVLVARLMTLPGHVLCVCIGAALGLEELCIAMVVSSGLATFLLALSVRNRLSISLGRQLCPATASMLIALASGAGASLSMLMGTPDSAIAALGRLVVGGGAGTLAAAATVFFGTHPLKAELQNAWRLRRAAKPTGSL